VALWSRMHECRDRLAVVGRLLAARVTAMSDITKCAGYIERDKSPRSPATWIAPKWLAHYLGARGTAALPPSPIFRMGMAGITCDPRGTAVS
jgi:hypothetical protein